MQLLLYALRSPFFDRYSRCAVQQRACTWFPHTLVCRFLLHTLCYCRAWSIDLVDVLMVSWAGHEYWQRINFVTAMM